MDTRKLARLKATNGHLHVGMQKDGTVLHFPEKGNERTAVMTKQLEFFIEHKMLEKLESEGINKKLEEMDKFLHYGFERVIWIEKLMERFGSFKEFLDKAQYDDIAILPGTTKQFSEDMMFKIRPPKEEPKKTPEELETERKKALEETNRLAEREAEDKRVREIKNKQEQKRLAEVAKKQNEKDEKKRKEQANNPNF